MDNPYAILDEKMYQDVTCVGCGAPNGRNQMMSFRCGGDWSFIPYHPTNAQCQECARIAKKYRIKPQDSGFEYFFGTVIREMACEWCKKHQYPSMRIEDDWLELWLSEKETNCVCQAWDYLVKLYEWEQGQFRDAIKLYKHQESKKFVGGDDIKTYTDDYDVIEFGSVRILEEVESAFSKPGEEKKTFTMHHFIEVGDTLTFKGRKAEIVANWKVDSLNQSYFLVRYFKDKYLVKPPSTTDVESDHWFGTPTRNSYVEAYSEEEAIRVAWEGCKMAGATSWPIHASVHGIFDKVVVEKL